MSGFGFGFGFSPHGALLNQWGNPDLVLFYGLYSEISGGQMPNKVTGATDYLTVAGSAGSETYQAPDAAPYKTADSDKVWFTGADVQRTVTTAELVGYDFGRTIIKYSNTTPYLIESILILKDGVTLDATTLNKLRDDFSLSIWWNNALSFHGAIKQNRGIGQSIWTPNNYTKLLLHFDNNILDSCNTAKEGTATNVVFGTTDGKFGHYADFNGTNSVITFADTEDFTMANDYTIDFWAKTDTASGASYFKYMIGNMNAAKNSGWAIGHYQGKLAIRTPADNRDKGTFNTNTWYHIALVITGSKAYLYLDGVNIFTSNALTFVNSTELLGVGNTGVKTANEFFDGKIEELRISKGIARWTANFTPPTAPYIID